MKALTVDQVLWAYRLILGREPETEHVVETHLANSKNYEELTRAFITSIEGLLKWQRDKIANIRAVFLHIPKTSGSSFFNLGGFNSQVQHPQG